MSLFALFVFARSARRATVYLATGGYSRKPHGCLSPPRRPGVAVQRPIPWLSLDGSYVENFGAANGSLFDRNGNPLPPETAQQWEVGFKTEFFDGQAMGTFAYFDLTKQNLAATDPLDLENPFRASPIGEVNSHGIELDGAGEILPGWNLIANYAYTKTKILNDNFFGNAGNRLPNVPENGGRVWSIYRMQTSALRGMTVGGGVTVRSQRQGNLANDFQLPSYTTVISWLAISSTLAPRA